MAEYNINKSVNYTREDLLNLGIYELRELGRDVGVSSPTTLKKNDLVDSILSIIYGEAPIRKVGKGRGRPTRKAEKTSRLFLDLVEKSNSPKCENIVAYGSASEYSFGYGDTISNRVASQTTSYSSRFGEVKEGVVCKGENDNQFVVRKLALVKSPTDAVVCEELVKKYNLKVNQIIKYYVNGEGKVIEVVSIDGDRVDVNKKQSKSFTVFKKEEVPVYDKTISSKNSSLFLVKSSAERQDVFNNLKCAFKEKGFSVVALCFDKICSEEGCISLTALGDEFQTLVNVEKAIDIVKFKNILNEKVVLLIDNIGWLMSVIETYPKALYGTMLEKITFLPREELVNITVIGISSYLESDKLNKLKGLFDNVVEFN